MPNYNLRESTDNYDRLMELFEMTFQEVSPTTFEEIRHDWFDCGPDEIYEGKEGVYIKDEDFYCRCPKSVWGGVVIDHDEEGKYLETSVCSWRDIEVFVSWMQEYDIDNSSIGEVFGIDPSEEPWIFSN